MPFSGVRETTPSLRLRPVQSRNFNEASMVFFPHLCIPFFFILSVSSSSSPIPHKVIIVGAGISGIMAAMKLSENGISDFLILEGSDRIGGRLHKRVFAGKTVEIGANWIDGVGGLHLNPVLKLANECALRTFFSDYSNLSSNYYDANGKLFASSVVLDLSEKQEASNNFSSNLVTMIRKNNEEDVSALTAQRIFGYVPETPLEMAIDYMDFDILMGESPRLTSLKSVLPLPTRSYYGPFERFVADERGYEHVIHRLAEQFLGSTNGKLTDARLNLRKIVREIRYGDDGVELFVEDGTSYRAEHAILSVSIGVLQSSLIHFMPELPRWKLMSIFKFDSAIFTKIFLKFPFKFWPFGPGTEFFVYASERRGYFTSWQHLEKQYPGSNILIATVIDDEARRIEHQSDGVTKMEAMSVLRRMFGSEIPDASEILVPRWGMDRLQCGSYSNWPIGVTNDDFEKMKAPVGPLYFTGEHTSFDFNGYVHGAYLAGIDTASDVLERLKNADRRKTQ